jgi:plastocyanin
MHVPTRSTPTATADNDSAATDRPRRRVAWGSGLGLGLVALAAVVLAACGSDEGGDLPAVAGPTSPRLEVRATEMSYEPSEIAVAAGEVEVVLHNEGSMLHDLRVADEPIVVEAGAGESTTQQVTLEAGRYEIFCSVPGHREAGMEGVLEVREP